MTVTADAESTRTVYNLEQSKTDWSEGDMIATKFVPTGTDPSEGTWWGSKPVTIDTSTGAAEFEVYVGYSARNKEGLLYAAYPFIGTASSSNWERPGDGAITIPSTQYPTATSFDAAADLMTANTLQPFIPSDSYYAVTLHFRHRAGFMGIRFSGLSEELKSKTVASVTLTADKPLVGKYDISIDTSTADMDFTLAEGTGSNTVTLDYAEQSIRLGDLCAYFAVMPGHYDQFAFTVVTADGDTISFARRDVGVDIKEAVIIWPTLTFDESRGDTVAEASITDTFTLTITPKSKDFAASTTDPGIDDAVTEFGLSVAKAALNVTTASYFKLVGGSTTKTIKNSNPIGSGIVRMTVSCVSYNKLRYSLSNSELDSGATNSAVNNLVVEPEQEGLTFFALSSAASSSASAQITKIEIEYVK